MKKIVKKILFAIFCMIFISLVVYSAASAKGAPSNERISGAPSAQLADEPELRADQIYFNTLDVRGQMIYDAIKAAVTKGARSTELLPFVITRDELSSATRALSYDDPSLYYVNMSLFDLENHSYTEYGKRSGYLVVQPSVIEDKYSRVWIPYTANNDDSSRFLEKSKNRFEASLKKADSLIKDVHDTFLVVQLIHDYLCGICTKTESGGVYADTAYGALVEGSATSLGYAKAFKLLYERYEGVSYIVNGGKDYWNVALIDDNYYNVDVYGDDLDGVLNGVTLRGVQSHLYLCLDDEAFYKDHGKSINSVPVCSDKTTYFSHNGFDPSTPSSLSDTVDRLVDMQRQAKTYYFEIYTELDNATALIKQATLSSLEKKYPEYADQVEVYRRSSYIPVYTVRMTKLADTEGTGQ